MPILKIIFQILDPLSVTKRTKFLKMVSNCNIKYTYEAWLIKVIKNKLIFIYILYYGDETFNSYRSYKPYAYRKT